MKGMKEWQEGIKQEWENRMKGKRKEKQERIGRQQEWEERRMRSEGR